MTSGSDPSSQAYPHLPLSHDQVPRGNPNPRGHYGVRGDGDPRGRQQLEQNPQDQGRASEQPASTSLLLSPRFSRLPFSCLVYTPTQRGHKKEYFPVVFRTQPEGSG